MANFCKILAGTETILFGLLFPKCSKTDYLQNRLNYTYNVHWNKLLDLKSAITIKLRQVGHFIIHENLFISMSYIAYLYNSISNICTQKWNTLYQKSFMTLSLSKLINLETKIWFWLYPTAKFWPTAHWCNFDEMYHWRHVRV